MAVRARYDYRAIALTALAGGGWHCASGIAWARRLSRNHGVAQMRRALAELVAEGIAEQTDGDGPRHGPFYRMRTGG